MAFQHNGFQSDGFQVQLSGSGAPATVIFDWYVELNVPRKRQGTIKHREYLFFTQHVPANFDETYSVSFITSVPVKRKRVQYQSFIIGLVPTELVTVDKWFKPLNEPLKKTRGYTGKNQLLAPFLAFETHTPASFTIPSILSSEGSPVRTRRRPYQNYAIGWDPRYLEFVSPDKWFRPLEEPKRPRRNRIIGPDLAYVKHIPPDIQAYVVDLIDTLPAKKRRVLYQTLAGYLELPTPVVVALVSSWYEDFNRPARRKKQHHPSVKDVVGLDPSGYLVPGVRRPREYSNRRYKDRYGMNIKSYGSRGLRR